MCLLKCLTCVFLAGLPGGGPRPRNLAADFHYLTGTLLVRGTRPMTSFSNCCIYKKYVMFYLNMLLNIVTYVGWSLYFDMFCFSWDLLRIHRNNDKPKANVKRLGSDWSRELTIMDTILLVKELWWVLLENWDMEYGIGAGIRVLIYFLLELGIGRFSFRWYCCMLLWKRTPW